MEIGSKENRKVFFPVGKIQENEFIFSTAYFKVVIFIIKFEPIGEFNFKKWICF